MRHRLRMKLALSSNRCAAWQLLPKLMREPHICTKAPYILATNSVRLQHTHAEEGKRVNEGLAFVNNNVQCTSGVRNQASGLNICEHGERTRQTRHEN